MGLSIRIRRTAWVACILALAAGTAAQGQEAATTQAASQPAAASQPSVTGPVENPWLHTQVYTVTSPYLGKPCDVEVLLPKDFDASGAKRYRVLYVLPASGHPKMAEGLAQLAQLDAATRYGLICVAANFDTVPWYGAHESDPTIRHEEHMLKVVLPLIESRYPVVAGKEGRLLMGFSKSGWGAFSLILRNPEVFGYAASWDAPLMMTGEDVVFFAIKNHFGSREQFERYLIVDDLRRQAQYFRDRPRLVVTGSDLFGDWPEKRYLEHPHTEEMHALLNELGIPHAYNPNLKVKHSWDARWMGPALELMMGLTKQPSSAASR